MAKRMHAMFRVADEGWPVAFRRTAFDKAERLAFDGPIRLCFRNDKAGFEVRLAADKERADDLDDGTRVTALSIVRRTLVECDHDTCVHYPVQRHQNLCHLSYV